MVWTIIATQRWPKREAAPVNGFLRQRQSGPTAEHRLQRLGFIGVSQPGGGGQTIRQVFSFVFEPPAEVFLPPAPSHILCFNSHPER